MKRFGINYFPDEAHYTRADADRWLPKIRGLGAAWLTLCGSLRRAIPEPFLQAVLRTELEPVIHIQCSPDELDMRATGALLRSYAEWGVQYIIISHRPNMQDRWPPTAWGHPSFVEGYVDRILPILQQATRAGLQPVLPPPQPGGDYWDLAFLEASLQALARRAGAEFVGGLVQGIYLWTHGREMDWGIGGQAAWPETCAYLTSPGAQDHLGMRLFEWYADVAEKVMGKPMRMLCAGGGPGPERVSPEQLEQDVPAIMRWLSTARLPDYLLSMSFSNALLDEADPDQMSSWFGPDGSPRKVVERVRQRRLADAKLATAKMPQKSIQHYLLVPAEAQLHVLFHDPEISVLIDRVRPTIGHSLDEAQRSSEVTLVGTPATYPAGTIEKLQAAGCQVTIMARPNGSESQASLLDASPHPQVSTGVSHG